MYNNFCLLFINNVFLYCDINVFGAFTFHRKTVHLNVHLNFSNCQNEHGRIKTLHTFYQWCTVQGKKNTKERPLVRFVSHTFVGFYGTILFAVSLKSA